MEIKILQFCKWRLFPLIVIFPRNMRLIGTANLQGLEVVKKMGITSESVLKFP